MKKINKARLYGLVAAKVIMETNIKPTLLKMGIKFDEFFEESSLYSLEKEMVLAKRMSQNIIQGIDKNHQDI